MTITQMWVPVLTCRGDVAHAGFQVVMVSGPCRTVPAGTEQNRSTDYLSAKCTSLLRIASHTSR